MYKSIICLSALLLLASCGQEKNNGSFELKGKLTGTNGETIYLEKLVNPQPVVVDSTVVDANGEFEFKNYQPKIGFYRMRTDARNAITLVLDSEDKVSITADIKDLANTYKVEGSPESSLFIEYDAISKKRSLQLDSLDKAFQAIMEVRKLDSLRMDSVSKLFEGPYNAIINKYNGLITEKIQKNTDMYASIIAIQGLEPDKFADTYRALDKGLSKKYPTDKNVIMFHDVVNKMLATTVGQPAPDIKLPSPDGKEIALSSLKGKVVLIDFWASWCGPCRKEMPNVVKAYAKFKNKGFEIYGVSLDKDKESWLEAVKSDGITWPQVSDLQFWNSEVVKLYSIEGIPYTVLLDKEGMIIAKNLRGADLDKKLTEVLN
ncbi:MAG: redoxin domain-containing protein [Bacteroidota bacterium]